MKQLDDFNALIDALNSDIRFVAKSRLDPRTQVFCWAPVSELSQPERRLLVKSVFSFIEALIFHLKSLALLKKPSCLSSEEIAICNDVAYRLKENGEVEIEKAKLKLLSNLRFAFNIVPKAYASGYKLNVSCPEWQTLKDAIKIRDRLTHPKMAEDVLVTDQEVENVGKAHDWFANQAVFMVLPLLKSQPKLS